MRSARSREAFSTLAAEHLGVRRDVVLGTFQHDTPGAMAYPAGTEHDWQALGETPVPGKTMGPIAVVERDYGAIAQKWSALGPLVEKLGVTTKGVTVVPDEEVTELAGKHGVMNSGAAAGRPAIDYRREDGRHDPRAVGDVERPPGRRGVPGTRSAARAGSWRTSRSAARSAGSPTPTRRHAPCR